MAAKRHRLAQRRKTVGFTQEGLAEQLGVDPTTVRRWESGEASPQPWLRPRLVRCLQVSVERLEELLHEPGPDDVSNDSQEERSAEAAPNLAVDDLVGRPHVDQLPPGLPDVGTESTTPSADAQNQETELATAYADAQARAQERRTDTASSPSPNGNGLVLPTGQEVLSRLASTVGPELSGSLAGPLLCVAVLTTPTQTTPTEPGESSTQLREQLRTLLREWANTMDRRNYLRLLGWVATTVAAQHVTSLDGDEQERVSKVMATPGRVDEPTIGHLETMLQHCKRQEDLLGPQAVLHTVIAQRDLVDSLLDECSDELRPRLLSVYSNMSSSIGNYFFDLEDPVSAIFYCDQARKAAQDARNTGLAIYALSLKSYFASWHGHVHTALDCAAAAQRLAGQSNDPLLQVCVSVESGMAYAVDGQHKACMTEFDHALCSLVPPAGNISPDSPVYWFHEGLVASRQGDCLLRLGKPTEAIAAAERGLQLFDSSFTLGLALCTLRLGTARLLSGEVEEAARVIGEGAQLATRNRSARLTKEVRTARSRMQPWEGTAAVRELDERLVGLGFRG